MKMIVDHLKEVDPDRVDKFKSAAQQQILKIIPCFKDWKFFVGETNGEKGMTVLMNFREDGVTPYLLFWKDGLVEEKVVCLCMMQIFWFKHTSGLLSLGS